MKTKLTEVLGIETPIILPGMSWISTPQLVAAVSNAGGLGTLATGPLSADETRAAIREIRSLTDRPFAIGATILMPGAVDNAKVALEEKVPVINFSLGKGDWITEQCHAYGGKVIATVTTLKHAKSAAAMGVDALQVTGHEAAAHGGEVTSLSLVPAIADAVDIPVIACGGFADGRGLITALALGAEGVAMGSRLATTQDSPLHQRVKDEAVAKNQHDTVYSKNFDGIPARYMKTPTAVKLTRRPMNFIGTVFKAIGASSMIEMPLWKIMAGLLAQFSKVKMLAYFGAAMPKLKSATEEGDLENGMQFIGQSQGLINDQPTVAELFERIEKEASETLIRTQAKLTG